MIDEAHGGGIFGENGRGLAEFYGVSERVEINMATLGKAIGCSGAYVAGRKVHQLAKAGLDLLNSQSQIIPILVGDNAATLEFSKRLFDLNILAMAVRPPTVPLNGARLRLTVMATHSQDELAEAVEQIKQIGRELAII